MYRITSGDQLKVVLPTGLTATGVTGNLMPSCEIIVFSLSSPTINNTVSCEYNGNDNGDRTITYSTNFSASNITSITWNISTILNPDSVRFLEPFVVSLGSETDLSISSITYQAASLESASVENTVQTAGTANVFNFTFRIANEIPQSGQIVITWPSSVSFQQTSNSAVNLTTITIYGATQTAGSFATVVNQGSKTIKIQNLFNSSALSVQPQDIFISIDQFKNPQSQSTSDSFIISTQNSNSEDIDKTDTGLTVTSSAPGTITVTSLLYTTTTVDQNFNVTINENTGFSPINGILRVYWPSEVSYVSGIES